MSFYDAIRVGASGAADFEVERSLRFNSADSAYLENTPSSAGNRKKNTLSMWVKLGVNQEFRTLVLSQVAIQVILITIILVW